MTECMHSHRNCNFEINCPRAEEAESRPLDEANLKEFDVLLALILEIWRAWGTPPSGDARAFTLDRMIQRAEYWRRMLQPRLDAAIGGH